MFAGDPGRKQRHANVLQRAIHETHFWWLKLATTSMFTGKRLEWYGHVMRMKEEHTVRRMLDVDREKRRGGKMLVREIWQRRSWKTSMITSGVVNERHYIRNDTSEYRTIAMIPTTGRKTSCIWLALNNNVLGRAFLPMLDQCRFVYSVLPRRFCADLPGF